jgi:hypothetical protein
MGLSSARLDRIKAWMHRQTTSGRLPGIEVLITRRGSVAFHHCDGMADIARGRPATNWPRPSPA